MATNHKYKLVQAGNETFNVMLGGDILAGTIVHAGIAISVPTPHLKLGWVVKGVRGKLYSNQDDAIEEAIRIYLAKEELADDAERIRRASSENSGESS